MSIARGPGHTMRRAGLVTLLVLASGLAGCLGAGTTRTGTAERMYVFDCGVNRTNDLSRWTPGANVGKAWEFSNNCYLIRHAKGMMIWDTGLSDAIAAMPEGMTTGGGAINARVTRTLASQLQAIRITPDQVTHLAFSHSHSDHVGNANYFTSATLYMQASEYDAAFGPNPGRFGFVPANYEKLRGKPVRKLDGDHDVFGDGSVVIIATPGHTVGHQSLLVRLANTGVVVLSGDLAHLKDNWDARRVPSMNVNADQTVQSMNKLAGIVAANQAVLLINHDKAISDKIAKSPFYLD